MYTVYKTYRQLLQASLPSADTTGAVALYDDMRVCGYVCVHMCICMHSTTIKAKQLQLQSTTHRIKQLTNHAIATVYRVTVSAFMISVLAGAPSPKKILRLKAAPSESGSGVLPRKQSPQWWLRTNHPHSDSSLATTCWNTNDLKYKQLNRALRCLM